MQILKAALQADNYANRLIGVLTRLAWVSLFFMMILTVADVVMRKVFNNSILGALESTELAMIVLIYFALAHVETVDGHVKVDLIVDRFGPRVQAAFDVLTQLIGSLMFGLMTLSSLYYAERMRATGQVTQDLWIPLWPFVYVVAIGLALMCLVLFFKCLRALDRMTAS